MLQDNFVINRTLIQKLGLSCAAYYTEIINTIFSAEGTSTSVALTMSHFSNTLGISRVKQENHRKKLEQLGVLKVERKGLPAKLHFSIDNQCEVNIKKILV